MVSGRNEKLTPYFFRHQVHFSLKWEYKRNIKGKTHLVLFPKVVDERSDSQRMQLVHSPETGYWRINMSSFLLWSSKSFKEGRVPIIVPKVRSINVFILKVRKLIHKKEKWIAQRYFPGWRKNFCFLSDGNTTQMQPHHSGLTTTHSPAGTYWVGVLSHPQPNAQ